MTSLLATLCGAMAGAGIVQALVSARMVASFTARRQYAPLSRPAVSVLKPLHGDEPLLEDALATLCQQDFPEFQIVFGVQDARDPAIAVVERLRQRFPAVDIALVVDPRWHGPNLKVGNLMNMLPRCRHDVLVIADSDIHVRPDYLDRLVRALEQPGIGLVTTLYAGLPAWTNKVASLGAMQITQVFLPGAVMARSLGRRDCLGATMAVRRDDLARIGGFAALVGHLADDNILGRRIAEIGLDVALADTVPMTTVPETTWRALFHHEVRWARTIRMLEPAGFAASAVQYPLAWALLAVPLSGAAPWSIGMLGIAWVLRAVAALTVDRALAAGWEADDKAGLAFCCPVWLLPLRDVFSVVVMLASYAGRRVDWRGHALQAEAPVQSEIAFRPIEGINSL